MSAIAIRNTCILVGLEVLHELDTNLSNVIAHQQVSC